MEIAPAMGNRLRQQKSAAEGSRLDQEVEQLLGDWDWDDNPSMADAARNISTGIGSMAMVQTPAGEPRHQW